MTLGIGDHIAKLKRDWSQEGAGKIIDPPTFQDHEGYVMFEVVNLDGCNQGDPDGFRPLIRVVK